ncbi:MAG: hypothetical protein WDZ40_02425 [Candidatus Spechtbacterales bacterium]
MKRFRISWKNVLRGMSQIFSFYPSFWSPADWKYEEYYGADSERLRGDWEKIGGDMKKAMHDELFTSVERETDPLKKKALIRSFMQVMRKQSEEADYTRQKLSQELIKLGGCGRSAICEYYENHSGPCSWEDGFPGC